MNNKLFRHVVFPAYHALKRTTVPQNIKELCRNQWLGPKQLTELQRTKLKSILAYSYRFVPFYQNRLASIGYSNCGSWDYNDFLKIPLLTKKDINKNLILLISKSHNLNELISNSTSGSTGTKLKFFHDYRSAYYRKAVEVRNQEWLGINLGDRSARLWGAPMDLGAAQSFRGRLHSWLNNILFLSSYNLTETSLAKYTAKLLRFKPKLLISYPGPVTILSEYLLRTNQTIPSIKAIICSAETLYPWQRNIIESAFNSPVCNRYGCREFGDIAQECACHSGLHIHSDRVFLEILDDNGNPVGPNETGNVVITDLDNHGMPFIRYLIGDRASFKEGQCECGRSLPLLDKIEGRTLDIVKAPNGNNIGGTFWTLLFRSRPGIASFQVIQENLQGITINYIPQTDASKIDFEHYRKSIKEKCGADFCIRFVKVDEIPKTPAGKTRFVVSRIKQSL